MFPNSRFELLVHLPLLLCIFISWHLYSLLTDGLLADSPLTINWPESYISMIRVQVAVDLTHGSLIMSVERVNKNLLLSMERLET